MNTSTHSRNRPVLVSFSGIAGSGKSTQIERLHSSLLEARASVLHRAFWDDVVFLPQFRAGVSHKVLRGEIGIGRPDKPVRRRDKNVRKWYLTLARSPFYFLDVLRLRRVVARALRSHADVIIFDRYIYDQLANLSGNWIGRLYLRFLLDAQPEAALARKPEYPLEFLQAYRRAYHRISSMSPEMVVIPPSDVEGVQQAISREFQKYWTRPELINPSSTLRDPQFSA
jgi:thymidylate kinase